MSRIRNCAVVLFFLCVPQLTGAQRNTWIATWATGPQSAEPDPHEPLLNVDNQTVRERMRISIGGDRIRIQLSNEYGSAPLLIGSATLALPIESPPADPASVQPGSIRAVTFGGLGSATIPAGARVLSDPVAFPVGYGAEIAISLYFPNRVVTMTLHDVALKRAVVSQRGDQTHQQRIDGGLVSNSSILVTAVLVPAQPSQRLVAAFGDSVVDGDGATRDADNNWPGDLIRRLAKTPAGSKIAVVNEGVAGNRLLSDGPPNTGLTFNFGLSALARFDRDALSLPGITHIVLLEGLNDIGFPGAKLGDHYLADPSDVRTAEDLIDGYKQLIARAHTNGVKIIGATIGPFEGVDLPGYYSKSKETIRQEANKWIRGGGAFDGVIDFDAVLRDPDHPSRLTPRFASNDHLHPNPAGYQAMADAIDLALFK